ncbi:hypothetical protein KW800_02015 [Candidatus Parcubacteria bacterium]|nr:hypothetical protein [Candidatus Parcubacteria bacterium]
MPRRTPHTSATFKKLKRLTTPEKVQDFLNTLPFNFEKKGETYRSVKKALEAGEAHCFEGALIAAAALQMHGHKPLLLDLRTSNGDADHVVALFKKNKHWGAVSKTNHAVLRYREPVYASVRELAMSYFHEYFLHNGTKTMRKFSKPFDLSKTKFDWLNSNEDLFDLVNALDHSPHVPVVPKGLKLRKAEKVEIKAGKIVEFKR